jgi:hypothetical protein
MPYALCSMPRALFPNSPLPTLKFDNILVEYMTKDKDIVFTEKVNMN